MGRRAREEGTKEHNQAMVKAQPALYAFFAEQEEGQELPAAAMKGRQGEALGSWPHPQDLP